MYSKYMDVSPADINPGQVSCTANGAISVDNSVSSGPVIQLG